MVQGGMSIVKFLLFVFNFIFVVCGIALIAVGAIAQISGKEYTAFLGSKYVTAPIIFIILGCVIFFIAFLGCYGALKQNYCMVMTFAVLLFLIFIVEISCGIAAYVLKSDIDNLLHKGMMEAFDQNATDTQTIFNEMQSDFPCCGVDGPEDYTKKGLPYPETCCGKAVEKDCKTPSNASCYKVLKERIKDKAAMVGGAGIGIGIIEILGIVFACCLASAIKKEYEGV